MFEIGLFVWFLGGYASWLISMNDTTLDIKFVPAVVALFVALLFGPFTVPLSRYFGSMIDLNDEAKREIERIEQYANRCARIKQDQQSKT